MFKLSLILQVRALHITAALENLPILRFPDRAVKFIYYKCYIENSFITNVIVKTYLLRML